MEHHYPWVTKKSKKNWSLRDLQHYKLQVWKCEWAGSRPGLHNSTFSDKHASSPLSCLNCAQLSSPHHAWAVYSSPVLQLFFMLPCSQRWSLEQLPALTCSNSVMGCHLLICVLPFPSQPCNSHAPTCKVPSFNTLTGLCPTRWFLSGLVVATFASVSYLNLWSLFFFFPICYRNMYRSLFLRKDLLI